MTDLSVLLSIVSAIVLFWYGLEAFSQQIQAAGGEALRKWLSRLTEKRWLGLLTGAAAVAIVQSSGAVTSLAAALVDAGVMSLRSSFGVLRPRLNAPAEGEEIRGGRDASIATRPRQRECPAFESGIACGPQRTPGKTRTRAG